MALRPLVQRRAAATLELEKPAEGVNQESQDQSLDNVIEPQQTSRTGQVAQGDDEALKRIAARLGHRPLDVWSQDRDPSKWKDHVSFLEDAPTKFEELRAANKDLLERSKRTAQAAADAIEEANRRTRLEAKAEIVAAAKESDPERAEKAAERLAEIPSGPPPQTVAWMSKNSWFDSDPKARALAITIMSERHGAKATIDDQLEAAEAEVRKRFPEHFPEARRESPPKEIPPRQEEVRMSESKRVQQAPAVQEGSRGGNGAVKAKGWNDIPSADRSMFQTKLEKAFLNRGLKPEEARAKWAQSYWRNLGDQA